MYSGRLSLVGDLLQSLFKGAYSLQKCFMEVLDKISLENSASEEEISEMITGMYLTKYCVYFIVSLNRMHIIYSYSDIFSPYSHTQFAGHLLCNIKSGHCFACQHMEICN